MMIAVRPPAVAGQFYPADARELRLMILNWLEEWSAPKPVPGLKGLIVPHAGYVYSGEVAARAYRLLIPERQKIRRVVLIGPAHRVAVNGLALTNADWFQTPLGRIPIDQAAREQLKEFSQVSLHDAPHAPEHSLEVQLPFLQVVLEEFTLVPLVYGRVSYQEVAEILEALWGGPETLFVISSDLSHFLDEAACRKLDRQTAHTIEALDCNRLDAESACGRKGIQALMLLAQKHDYEIRLLELKNSGATSGDLDRVVGYGAFVMEARKEQSDV